MNYDTLGKYIVVNMRKPMNWKYEHGYDFVRVRKRYFDEAKKSERLVLVRTPKGERVFSPNGMKKFKVVKEVFLPPDKPMKMYELVIPHCKKKPDEAYAFM